MKRAKAVKCDAMNWEILIREPAGISRVNEYVRVAVPFAKGELLADTPLCLTGPAGESLPTQTKILKLWSDGSLKWLLVDAAVSIAAGSSLSCRLIPASEAFPVYSPAIAITSGADTWQIDTGCGIFILDARTFRPFTAVLRQGVDLLGSSGSSCTLSVDRRDDLAPVIDAVELEDHGPLHAIIRLTGRFSLPEVATGVRFVCRLHFFAGSMAVKIEYTLHNPQSAAHPGGLWDLGDSGSLLFRELALIFPFASGSVTGCSCVPETGLAALETAGNLSIYQQSSGGEYWQSPNHRSRHGMAVLSGRGYVVEADGEQVATGLRATPLVRCAGAKGGGVAATLPNFWKEFPKEIAADASQLRIALFPARFPDGHELQGGEQKTTVVALDFAAGHDPLLWALATLQSIVPPEAYRKTGIFSDLPGDDDLIDQFASPAQILAKREVVDEYGWRNFGDLHADHEAVFHKGEQPFISHYNNQYDFSAGAWRKFFASGDPCWHDLAADMGHHLLDIDIYHTELDREEYNHGLFWHTDHYLDAGLSTHRSFSREQLQSKPAHLCGGGPGPEQCYTTGLMLHYFQTGNPDFKSAVIDLAEWVLKALNGSQTFLAALKRSLDYMRLWRENRGRQRLFPRYPLTRGTGNAITACLDAFEVSVDRRYIDQADLLIRETLHQDDDINARDLLNAEVAWSYTVLLAAVAKFLDKKAELAEFDAGFSHARASLLAYAEWMLQHEYPYLDKPEILEYPNETWAAQDLRKSVVLYSAARYAPPEQRSAFLQKAALFFEYARTELLRHESSKLTRPLVLMLQNGWVGSRLSDEAADFPYQQQETDTSCSRTPTTYLTLGTVLSRCLSDLISALRQTNLQHELAWLKARVVKREG